MKRYLTSLVVLLFISAPSVAQNYSDYNQQFVDEHIYEGFPGYNNIYVRQAYVLSFSHEHRIPGWVAYHVVPDYLKTVPRYDIFNFFRVDRNIPNPVNSYEYNRLEEAGTGYAGGHLAPFGISGGDRDGDLLYGVADLNRDGKVTREDMTGHNMSDYLEDADEISRVYEINHLSNVAPMHRDGFNGPDGIWGKLEDYLQDTIVRRQKKEIWVFAGTVLGRGEMEKAGPNNNITVPPMFFKIAVRDDKDGNPIVLAFLVPHHKEPHGDVEDYLVSVDIIEAMTGLDFFRELDDRVEEELENRDTSENWDRF